MKILIVGIYLFLSAAGLILFKYGASNSLFSLTQGILNIKINCLSLIGVICYVCSFIIYLGLVSKYNLSYIVPVTTGIMQIIILIASYFIFKEVITFSQIIGVVLVLIGIVLIN